MTSTKPNSTGTKKPRESAKNVVLIAPDGATKTMDVALINKWAKWFGRSGGVANDEERQLMNTVAVPVDIDNVERVQPASIAAEAVAVRARARGLEMFIVRQSLAGLAKLQLMQRRRAILDHPDWAEASKLMRNQWMIDKLDRPVPKAPNDSYVALMGRCVRAAEAVLAIHRNATRQEDRVNRMLPGSTADVSPGTALKRRKQLALKRARTPQVTTTGGKKSAA